MADNLSYTTAELVQVVPNLKTSQNFLLNRYFGNVVEYNTEEVAIDVDVGLRRMSPFVSPLVEGKLVEQRKYLTNKYRPPYIKDKRAPDLRRPVRRAIGERIGGGEMTGEERMQLNLEAEMADQVDMINRRLEWMAAQALVTGTVTISGSGFPTALIDFGRAPALTVALTGAAAWGGTLNAAGRDVNIVPQIMAWRSRILKAAGNVDISDIVFTPSAYAKFLAAEGVQGAIQTPAWTSFGNNVNPAGQVGIGQTPVGMWGGYTLWLYNDWFIDANQVEQPMLPDGTIIMCGPEAMLGTRAFGQIIDPKFAYKPMAYAPKTWMQDDPAQTILMMQSAPLVIPSRVNACLAATVCAPLGY